jgi:hypothetical protein
MSSDESRYLCFVHLFWLYYVALCLFLLISLIFFSLAGITSRGKARRTLGF